MKFNYRRVKKEDLPKIKRWLDLPHIRKWIHGKGLQSTQAGLLSSFDSDEPSRYWIASETEDFAFLIASRVNSDDPDFKGISFFGSTVVGLDIFIANSSYLGWGLAPGLISDFLLTQFPEATDFVIDPEASNQRAIHVYEKVGFTKKGEFIASWNPVPHWMMHVSAEKLKTIAQDFRSPII